MVYGSSISHEIWIQDIYQILAQEVLDKIVLLGHSMGAQLALHYAIRHPDQVAGLILIDPTLPKQLKGKLAIARRIRYLLWFVIVLMRMVYKFIPVSKLYPVCDLHALDLNTRELMINQSVDLISKLYTSPKEDLKYLPLLNYLQDLNASISPLPAIAKIQCPVNIILSKSSSIVRLENVKNYFDTDATVDIKSIDANHWPLTEKPEETRRSIDDWCQNLLTTAPK